MLSVFVGEYVLALVITLGVLAWAGRIRTRCVKVLWLDDYFNYLLFFYLAAIGGQIIPLLGFRMFPLTGFPGKGYYFLFQVCLRLPLVLVSIYYFLRFTEGIAGRNPSPALGRDYILGSALIFIAGTFLGLWAIHSGKPLFLLYPQTAIGGLSILILALLPIRAALRARSAREPRYFRSLARFAAVQIGSLAAGQAILVLAMTEDPQFEHHFIRLFVNIPPLAILARIAEKEMAAVSNDPESRVGLKEAFVRLGVTTREGEIIQLVLMGKTNAEIAAALFISLKTVKHHLYNIYLKLHVKNRVQLANLFLTIARPEPRPDGEPGKSSA
ncbi:MAG: helix-turn-helix transcriptional regulator [Candidatus Aminicenantes bacterium]|nr:helix-turn-helix transcriptional regulator [Candidatus Aminicenantes bacterium]